MKKYRKNLILALVCFLIVIVLNFFLPRLLPGNPIAYLTGFSEEDMTPAQVAYYRQALHLDKPVFVQFGYYLRSLADGTLGYSFKKEATVSALIGQRLGYTLQITLPAVLLSTVIGLLWGLRCGYKKGSSFEKISTTFQIIVNTMPTFLIALVLLILFCFRQRWFPYTGLEQYRGRSRNGRVFLGPDPSPDSPGADTDRRRCTFPVPIDAEHRPTGDGGKICALCQGTRLVRQ